MSIERLQFGPFLLHTGRGTLERDGQSLRIRPKTLAVLTHLARRPGELVHRDDLLAAVWPEVKVEATVVKVCIRELRNLLADDAAAPRFIENVPRRGYRFIAEVRFDGAASADGEAQPIVGRGSEIETLDSLFAEAAAGSRRLVFLSGEAGIGKSTLIEVFRARASGKAVVARGQCIERLGESEPFLPFLEAIGRLCRNREGDQILPLLRRFAPTWLLQLPELIDSAERDSLQLNYSGTTAARMMREMVIGLERIAGDATIVLLLEDVHWADSSTLELLAALGRRSEAARLFVLATYRSAGEGTDSQQLATTIGELLWHRQATRLELAGLGDGDVALYLTQAFPGISDVDALAALLRARTGGNPLFLLNVLAQLRAAGALRRHSGSWRLVPTLRDLEKKLPETLLQALHVQTSALTREQSAVLEAASVVGGEFAAALVAAALDMAPRRVEEICAGLARQRGLLRRVGEARWADTPVSSCYTFAHDLHRASFYDRLPAPRRRSLHLHIGETLESLAGSDREAAAGALANHFELAGDGRRSAIYHLDAGRAAVRRYAYREATDHLERGLSSIVAITEHAECERLELALNAELGVALINARGFAAPEVKRCYDRALELCPSHTESAELFPILEGLHSYFAVVGDLAKARDFADRMLAMSESSGLKVWQVEGHHTSGCVELRCARMDEARRHLRAALDLYDAEASAVGIRFCGHDPKVCCLGNLAVAEHFSGYSDRGLDLARAALAHAERIAHPYSLGLAEQMLAWLHLMRFEAEAGLRHAEAALALATDGSFAQLELMAALFRAWALAAVGRTREGSELLAQAREILALVSPPTVELDGILVAVLPLCGRVDETMDVVTQALDRVDAGGPHYLHANLLWVRGELHLAAGRRDAAEVDLERARNLARRQRCPALELPPTLTLARLWRDGCDPRRAYRALRDCRKRFEAGCSIAPLVEADGLLAALRQQIPVRAAAG